ncbi:SRPBCC family protein [Calycomorphotria hydatis]|uniref:Coenzyme Q-binding protein COQ10 START domain-containing protein n=1 Tax=Calycomorphotria hydatis TaxID=2528027 RepID=A0A517T454_9PLAN|nr:SRPBCC family protein [Calycomorphotria hydatis]QDT63152.1 hypothetical protein V22_03700 [Calycomorphotria hydatis]
MPEYETRVTVAAPAEEVFDFLIKPENITKVTSPEAGLHFVSAPDEMELGSRSEVEVRGFGPAQKLIYEVAEFIRPDHFTEVLVKGPMKAFRNQHIFESRSGDCTAIINRIEFQPPGGMLGMLLNESLIRSTLAQGFEYRHKELITIFGEA